jgi:hypothetical protein
MKHLSTISLLCLMQASTAFALEERTAEQARFEELSELFADANLVEEPTIVPCTLSGGAETSCISISVVAAPSNHTTGPFCPRTIDDTPESGGTWMKDGLIYDVDGAFIKNLAETYQDDQWQMFDPDTGAVTLVEGLEGCAVAGDPNSADENVNTCVECELKYMGSEVTQTYVLPLTPVMLEKIAERMDRHSGIGLAFNGVKFDAPAPVDLILGGHTLGPLDDCGGHINPHTGYHYHGALGCETQIESSIADHAPMIALAMDGLAIHSRLDRNNAEPTDLDACRGHEVDGLGYHYHANAAGSNQTIGCFAAQTGCTQEDSDAICDASAASDRRGPPPSGDAPRPE